MQQNRKQEMLEVAMEVSRESSYLKVSQTVIAQRLNCAAGLTHYHFGTLTQLRRAVMRAAIHQGDLQILAQGLVAKDKIALAAPLDMRTAAAQSMIGS